MPIVTLTFIPGLKSAVVAFCPFTLISVNFVIANVRLVLLRTLPVPERVCVVTVIRSMLTLEMTVS